MKADVWLRAAVTFGVLFLLFNKFYDVSAVDSRDETIAAALCGVTLLGLVIAVIALVWTV